MKKLISYLLVLVLAFSAVSTVTFAKGEQLLTSDEYMQNVVTGLNLVNTKLSEKEAITRADFALILMNLINEPVTASGNTSYADVTGASKETAAIEKARNMELMVGVGYNQFAPSQPILFSQAVKLILKATKNIRVFNDEEIIAEDNFRKLTKGLSFADTASVDYETLVHLVFNALDVTVPKATFDNPGTMSGDMVANEKLPEYFFGYKRVEGVLQADAYSSIVSAYGNGNTVTINGVNYKSTNDYNAHLGCYVDAFVNEDNEVVFLTANDENNIIVLDRTNATYAGRVYTYEVESGRVEKVSIPDGTPIAYNERAMASYSDAKMLPQDGYVTLIDNNDDGTIDVVRVVEYVNIVVKGSLTEENKTQIFDSNTGITSTVLTDAEGDTTIIVDTQGVAKEIKNLREGIVASVIGEIFTNAITGAVESVDARRVIISGETVTGKVKMIDTDEGTISLDDKAHYYDARFDISALSFGRDYTFSLDFAGKIASANVVDSADIPWALAYIIDASLDSDGVCTLKVVTPYDKIIKYKCAEKVKIDGESGKISNHNLLLNKFEDEWGVAACDPVIGYTVDEEKKIDKILFADNSYSSDVASNKGPSHIPSEFGIYGTTKGNYRWYAYFKTFFGKVTADEETIIFAAPETVNAETKETEYKAIRMSDLKNDKQYDVKGYIFGKDSMYEDIIVVKSEVEATVSTTANLAVVKDISQTLNEDDEVVFEVSVIENQNEKAAENIYAASNKVIGTDASGNSILEGKEYDASGVGAKHKINKGDTIAYSLDARGEIAAIDLIATDVDNIYGNSDYVGNESTLQETMNRRILPAKVYSIDNKFITLVKSDVEPKDAAWGEMEEVTLDRVAIVVVEEDAGKTTVRMGSVSDIDSYIEKGKSSRVLIQIGSYISRVLVVYNK